MREEVGWTVSLHRQSWSCCDLEEEERKRQQERSTAFQRSGFYKTSGEGIECMSYSCRRIPPTPPHEHTRIHNTQGIDKGRERDWKRK